MTCTRCGANLSSRNKGPLCYPCGGTVTDQLGSLIGAGEPWWPQGRCVEYGWRYPAELFFTALTSTERPIAQHGGLAHAEREAKACCLKCPVRRECLELALSWEERGFGRQEGIWGGTLFRERNKTRGLPLTERVATLMDWMDRQALERGLAKEGVA